MAHIVTGYAWTFCKIQAHVAYCCGLVVIKRIFAIAKILKQDKETVVQYSALHKTEELAKHQIINEM